MGITTWHLRDKVHAPVFFQAILRDAAQKIVGLIIADVDESVPIDEQKKLLQKMAEALTSHIEIIETGEITSTLSDGSFVILLGENSKKKEVKPDRRIYSYALTELLAHSDYKKTLWSQMKSLKLFFS